MKHYVNCRYGIIEDDELIDSTSDADTIGLVLGFIAVLLVLGLCLFMEL